MKTKRITTKAESNEWKWWKYSSVCNELVFKVRHMDSALYLVIDSMLGIALVYLIIYFDVFIKFWPLLFYSIKKIDLLIDWLTQYPAGLKLNDDLNEPLSSFFKYHIELWKKNMKLLDNVVMPMRSWTKEFLFSLALPGASVMLTAFSDFGRLITLHMYCFYLYTLRLTKVSWHGIRALAKAFRGKKWNPLRQRVDSVKLDSRELFIATIFFIVLLFLLPTVLVYFVVFYCLWFAIDFSLNMLTFAAQMVRHLADVEEEVEKGMSIENVLTDAKLLHFSSIE